MDINLLLVACILFATSMLVGCDKDEETILTDESKIPLEGAAGYVEYPEWFKNTFYDIQEDIDEASENNKRLIVYFYQNGCPYCKKLIEYNLAREDIAQLAKNNFDIISVNIFGSVEITDVDGEILTEKEFSKKENINFTPSMITYNDAGQIIFRMNGYYPIDRFTAMLEYLSEKKEDDVDFLTYLEQHKKTE